jgi:hypothetical protein
MKTYPMELRQKIVDTVDRQLGAYRPYGVGWSGLNSLKKKTRLAQEADPCGAGSLSEEAAPPECVASGLC